MSLLSQPLSPLFGTLPWELRHQILIATLPRTIRIQLGFTEELVCGYYVSPDDNPAEALMPLPMLFSLNREYREYSFSQCIPFGPTFIQPTLDTLYLTWDLHHDSSKSKFKSLNFPPMHKLQNMAVQLARYFSQYNDKYRPFSFPYGPRYDATHFYKLVNRLRDISKLVVCLNGSDFPVTTSLDDTHDIIGFAIDDDRLVTRFQSLVDPRPDAGEPAYTLQEDLQNYYDESYVRGQVELPAITQHVFFWKTKPNYKIHYPDARAQMEKKRQNAAMDEFAALSVWTNFRPYL